MLQHVLPRFVRKQSATAQRAKTKSLTVIPPGYAYVPAKQELHPHRTQQLCQSLAGNSFHPNLIIAMLGGEENIRNYITGAQRASCVDATSAATPQQVREYFAAMILGPILEQADRKKQLQEAWRTSEGPLNTLSPYRHLQHYDPERQPAAGIQQQEQLTSLISALQWWAGQPAATVAISPSTTVILVHVPSAEAPILLHIGTKRPRVAHYVQQYAGKQTIRQ